MPVACQHGSNRNLHDYNKTILNGVGHKVMIISGDYFHSSLYLRLVDYYSHSGTVVSHRNSLSSMQSPWAAHLTRTLYIAWALK